MGKQKKIHLYVHHGRYLHLKSELHSPVSGFVAKKIAGTLDFFYYIGLALIKIMSYLKKGTLESFFLLGSGIIKSAEKIFRTLKRDIIKTAETLPKRIERLFTRELWRTLAVFGIVAALGWAGIGSLHLVAQGLALKDKILQTTFIGQHYLNQAKDDLGKQDFIAAEANFTLASQTFSRGQQNIEDSGAVLNQLLDLVPQKRDADRLIQAAGLLAQAGQDLTGLSRLAGSLKINVAGVSSQTGPVGDVFKQIDSQTGKAQSELSQANDLVNSVDIGSLPEGNRQTFLDLKDKLSVGLIALNNFKQVFSLAEALSLGQKTVLLLFENNNELRATGGFIGTYGALKINDGVVSKIDVSSIYDLDGQLTDIIQPPLPLLNVGDRWHMRDANWFADFSASAQKVSGFYEQAGGETPDLVLALTPNIIVDWLKITGPIALPKYGVTLTSDNFVEQTQAITTITNNLPTNSPKQLLADLVPLLLQKLSASDAGAYPQILQSLQDNLNNKQIVAYSRDPDLEQLLQNFNWAGTIAQTDRDYLSVVSSNLGGTKTDLALDQKINLVTSVGQDGQITDELTITRTNKMADLPDTQNTSFIRILVPQGSKLVSALGFDLKNLAYPDNLNYKIDPEVFAWEKNSVTDNLTGTIIGEESGKTFLGNWLELKGGESKTIKLTYILPFNLGSIDRYSLLLQKQIGAVDCPVSWALNFPNRSVQWKNFDPTQLNTDNLNSDIILDKDYFLGVVLERR